MIVHDDIQQGTAPWHALRIGTLTASRSKVLVTAGGKESKGDGVQTLINDLVFERVERQYAREISTSAMRRGTELEVRARQALEWDTGKTIDAVGFISTDDGRVGCSPDGMIAGAEPVGVELKVPMGATHVGYYRDPGRLLRAYRHQVQFGMWVTGWASWILRSHSESSRIPHVTLRVERDEDYITTLAAAAKAALEAADETLGAMDALRDDSNPFA